MAVSFKSFDTFFNFYPLYWYWPSFICCPRNINCWITYLCELFCNLREIKQYLTALNLSWEKSKLNFFQCILMAGFFWFITILTITILSAISGSYEELNQISQTYTIISSSLAIYIQVCLISFPILVFYKNQSLDEIKDSI